MKDKSLNSRPTVEEIENELGRLERSKSRGELISICISSLVIVAAIAVLVATMWLPALQVTGSSMSPTLNDGDIIIAVKNTEFERGDLVAFYHNEKVLVKRIAGMPGDVIEVSEIGEVYINGEYYDESWISEAISDAGDIEYPITVQDGYYFVLGDNRPVSMDSRYAELGPISSGRIVGKVIFRLWPVAGFGIAK